MDIVGDGEIPLIGEMSEGQKGLGKAVPSTSPKSVDKNAVFIIQYR